MHCERCNIDFPEGLRFCKWCGQPLGDRPRVTSELLACPDCSATVRPGWTFCKSCGKKLETEEPAEGAKTVESSLPDCPRCGAQTEPGWRICGSCGAELAQAAPPAKPTAVDQPIGGTAMIISHCSTCGDPLEPGSSYCKACGSPVYVPSGPFGQSSLLCRTCNSYSPIGSNECRVCGTLFSGIGLPATDVITPPGQEARKTSSTLPDLPEHMPEPEKPEESGTAPMPSGGNAADATNAAGTLVFTGIGTGEQSPSMPLPPESQAPPMDRPRGGAETTVLPGVAGSKSERQSPTAFIPKKRDTNPVEAQEKQELQEPGVPKRRAARKKRAGKSLSTQVEIPAHKPPVDQQQAVDKTIVFSSGSSMAGSGLKEQTTGEDAAINPTAVIGEQPQAPPASPPAPPAPPAPPSKADKVDSAPVQQTVEIPMSYYGDVATAPFGIKPPEEAPPAEARAEAPAAAPEPPEADLSSTRVIEQPPPPPEAAQPAPVKPAPVQPATSEPEQAAPQVSPPATYERSPSAAAQVAPKQKSSVAVASIIVGALVVALTGAAIWWFMAGGRRDPTPQTLPAEQPQAQAPAQPQQPPAPVAPAVPDGMVAVPAGLYTVGRDDGDALVRPEHKVQVAAFFIDKTEVTNADYKKFVDATGHKPPKGWAGTSYEEGRGNWPVVGVTWQDAIDYATWVGKRLPTEEEWEAAARGPNALIYPWGNQWREGMANIGQRRGAIMDVGQFPEGKSPFGALDMIGNVWEWTADEFELYPGSLQPIPSDIKPELTYRVIRGGAFDGDKTNDASYRGYFNASEPLTKTGFRCAKDAK